MKKKFIEIGSSESNLLEKNRDHLRDSNKIFFVSVSSNIKLENTT